MQILFTIGAVLIVGYAVLVFLLFLGQNRLVFPGGRIMDRSPATAPFCWEYDDLYVRVGDETTNAWYIPLENPRGVVLFSHGNGGSMSDRLESCDLLRGMGFSVLVYDYGGYGRSSGNATEERCYADARAMWRYLMEERHIAPEKILLFGRSLGGAVTLQLATEVQSGAVIVESTFLSIPQIAKEKAPIFPMYWLMRNRFDNASKIPRIKAPILIVHSPDDTLIPYPHGRKLFDLANEPKQFLAIRGDHNEGFIVSGEFYRQGLAEFLSRVNAFQRSTGDPRGVPQNQVWRL